VAVERAEARLVPGGAGPQVQGVGFALVAGGIQGVEMGAAVGEEPLEHPGGPGFDQEFDQGQAGERAACRRWLS
jgi:hypothetical protein